MSLDVEKIILYAIVIADTALVVWLSHRAALWEIRFGTERLWRNLYEAKAHRYEQLVYKHVGLRVVEDDEDDDDEEEALS